MATPKCLTGNLGQGKQRLVLDECPTAAGSESVELGILADTVIVTRLVTSISGDLDVKVETVAGSQAGSPTAQTLEVITFPTVSAPTTELVIRKAAAINDRIRVTATYTDAAKFQVIVRGTTTGENTVSILGPGAARASQIDVSAAGTLLIPASLADREGLVVKNFASGGEILYVGFTPAESAISIGYPLSPGEAIGIDLGAGEAVYGTPSAGTVDTRLIESGT